MKQSEFWNALDLVYGPVLGRSLAHDLYLPQLQGTANEALLRGEKTERVWGCLVAETGHGEEALWAHRRPTPKK